MLSFFCSCSLFLVFVSNPRVFCLSGGSVVSTWLPWATPSGRGFARSRVGLRVLGDMTLIHSCCPHTITHNSQLLAPVLCFTAGVCFPQITGARVSTKRTPPPVPNKTAPHLHTIPTRGLHRWVTCTTSSDVASVSDRFNLKQNSSLCFLSDECLRGRSDHPSVFHRDVSLPLFSGGLPLQRPPRGGRRAAVPPRTTGGRHHAQREEARGQQQQRRPVQMRSHRGGTSFSFERS